MYQTGLFAATYRPHASRSKPAATFRQSLRKRKRYRDSSSQDSAASDATEIPPFKTYPELDRGLLEANASDISSDSSDAEEREESEENFPHAYRSRDRATMLLDKDHLTKELEGLKLDPNSQLGRVEDKRPRQQPTLRQQHLTNVVTILHRCLLQGDYDRASRAWGILLRVEQKRDPYFLRSNGRWGIGVEILLRRNVQPANNTGIDPSAGSVSETDDQEIPDLPQFPAALSEDGFENVKTYFNDLSVLYPRQKGASNAIDELVFRHTMFALWICFVQEHAVVIERGKQSRQSQLESDIDSDGMPSESGRSGERLRESQSYLLEQAKQIHSELEELVMKAEYADDESLCNLRDMAEIWVNDLQSFGVPSP